ncbi:MAG: hypothetical protein ACE37H_17115 [Phycisphaeraceae bacterium]
MATKKEYLEIAHAFLSERMAEVDFSPVSITQHWWFFARRLTDGVVAQLQIAFEVKENCVMLVIINHSIHSKALAKRFDQELGFVNDKLSLDWIQEGSSLSVPPDGAEFEEVWLIECLDDGAIFDNLDPLFGMISETLKPIWEQLTDVENQVDVLVEWGFPKKHKPIRGLITHYTGPLCCLLRGEVERAREQCLAHWKYRRRPTAIHHAEYRQFIADVEAIIEKIVQTQEAKL